MDWLESFKMAGRTLLGNKLRSSLTMLGIIIGNASVIFTIGVGQGAQQLAAEQFEAVILSVAGGFIGTSLGVAGIATIGAFSPLNAPVSGMAIALATGVSGGIGLAFGILPARQAAKLDPIVALRSA